MIESVEKLTSPPCLGVKYLVPCVFSKPSALYSGTYDWWPVLSPSHQDSKYFPSSRLVWKTDLNGIRHSVKEVFYQDDLATPHHFHVDPRFVPIPRMLV